MSTKRDDKLVVASSADNPVLARRLIPQLRRHVVWIAVYGVIDA
jgi:hypothetical protein